MERKRFCSFMLVLVLLLTMVPVGVYAEDPVRTVRVSNQTDFVAAITFTDAAITHVIAESMECQIPYGIALEKDLTISTSASLYITEGALLIVPTGIKLRLDGNAIVRGNAELRVGGTLINNAELQSLCFG